MIEKGLTIGGKPLKDHLEAIGHKAALDYIRRLAPHSEPLREGDVREIHRLVLGRADPDEAGRYSRHQRAIAGSPLILPTPAEIPALMGDFALWLAAAPNEPATAFLAHARLVAIHPFSDGNGRHRAAAHEPDPAKGRLSALVIGPEQRAAYVDALQALQLNDDPGPYSALMAERLEASLDHHLAMARRGLGA